MPVYFVRTGNVASFHHTKDRHTLPLPSSIIHHVQYKNQTHRQVTCQHSSLIMKIAALFLLSLLSTAWAFAPSFGVMRSSTELSETRKPFITGNWKLNPQTREEAVTLASEIAAAIGSDSPEADVALFVPYVFIEAAMHASGGKLSIGAEVCCFNRL